MAPARISVPVPRGSVVARVNQNEIDYTAGDWVDEAIDRLARDQGFVDVAYGVESFQKIRFRIDRYRDDADAPVGLRAHRLPYHGGFVCFVEQP